MVYTVTYNHNVILNFLAANDQFQIGNGTQAGRHDDVQCNGCGVTQFNLPILHCSGAIVDNVLERELMS